MNRKLLAVWMVLFIFAHAGITAYFVAQGGIGAASRALAAVLGFPLLRFADEPRLLSFIFANSVLWGFAFGAIGVFRMRER